jgi:plasmid maintenance system antidote protein VapI
MGAGVKRKMRPVHPREILREESLLLLGMSVKALAHGLHVPSTRLHEIVKERRSIRQILLRAWPGISVVMHSPG